MGAEPADALGAAVLLARAFERHGVSYAIGGALAYGLWGLPRATIDVDVNVFVEPPDLDPVFDALEELGINVARDAARTAGDQQGMFMVHFGMFRVDVFTPSIEFAWEAARTRVKREVDGQAVWFLSAEAIAVFKLLFFRGKDLVDLEHLIALRGPRLDVMYIRSQVVQMMGPDDERVRRFDELVALRTKDS